MVGLQRKKTIISHVVFQLFFLVLVASCTFQPNEPDTSDEDSPGEIGCPETSVENKDQLENGIRGQVKFLDEEENLSAISSKMAEYDIPALSLAIINDGKIAWADVYQNSAFPDVQPLNCTSLFQAASLSKPVTFLAALRMHAAGEIDLDRDIQEYLTSYALPQGKQSAEHPVTLRNIFSHTSGITAGGYEGYENDLPFPSDLEILLGGDGVNTPAIEVIATPGEALAYSGGGYTLAEVALQDIYEDEFADIMKKWILDPAGMNNSTFSQPLPARLADHVAKGHTAAGMVVDGGWRNHPEQAAAGLWSNAADLARFLIEIYNAYQGHSSIFSQADIRTIIEQERDSHVYGFIVRHADDDISITHYGGNVGYRTGMTISLTSGKGLVYLINSDNGGALGNELLLSASQVYQWKHFMQTAAKREYVAPDFLAGLSGNYKWNNQIDLSVSFNETDSLISLFFPNGDEYKLVPVAGDNLDFIHPATGVEVSFINSDEFILYGQTAVRH